MPTEEQTKRVLVLLASPRKNGNCSYLVDRLTSGVVDAGGKANIVFISALNIAPCKACDWCMKNENHQCIIEDDMQIIRKEILLADAIVFASPVYWFNYTAQLKLVIDRTYAIRTNDNFAFTGKKIGIIMTYEDMDIFSSGGVNALRSLQDMCKFVRAEIVGIVHSHVENTDHIKNHPEVLKQAYELGRKLF